MKPQRKRQSKGRASAKPRALDAEALERLALFYVGRYATTRARLRDYLKRKIGERGWTGDESPDPDPLVERLARLGYVDDAAFASARAASLARRGYGERRLTQALAAAGVRGEEAEAAREQARGDALESALRFAQRRQLGPFAPATLDRARREKAFAAMIRAGHPLDVIRKVLDSAPGEMPNCDSRQK
ncbi:MAG TPA: RecX family transcriptional regulator [Allosphingosinicella sp.]|nr:RecX family transcriptional regulator [Allosphingosinicella sp.]